MLDDVTLLDDDAGAGTEHVKLPHQYRPRDYQRPVWEAMFPADPLQDAVRRAVLVWHRRAGKDKTCVNLILAKAVERVGMYLYLLPTQTQARKVIWRGIGKDGVRFIDHFPEELVANKNSSEMFIELVNGSIIQLGGADNYDALMGSNPLGIIFSEYSLQNPNAWDYFRPILAENAGWAVMEFTPRGKNHGYHLYKRARKLMKSRPHEWFCQLLTVDDTQAIPPEAIQDERESGMSEEMIEQEFFCSFNAFNQGAVYGKQIKLAWEEERVTFVPPDPSLDVHTFWDLGFGDSTAIWLAQCVGKEVRLVGYYENSQQPLAHYFKWLNEWAAKRDLRWGEHWGPHDLAVHELQSGKRRLDYAAEHGFDFEVVPRALSLADGIEAVRAILPRCWFDETGTERGLNCLTDYSWKWDDDKKIYLAKPDHNWASHGADAFRTLAVALHDRMFDGAPDLVSGPSPGSGDALGWDLP